MHRFIMELQRRFRESVQEAQTARLLPGLETGRGTIHEKQEQELLRAAFKGITSWFLDTPEGRAAGAYYDAWDKEYLNKKG